MSDYLSSIAERSLNQVRVILPRVASKYEPVASSSFITDSSFTDQGESLHQTAMRREDIGFLEQPPEMEISQPFPGDQLRDHRPSHSVFRHSALRRNHGPALGHTEKIPPNNLGPVPISSRPFQKDDESDRSDQSSRIMVRAKEIFSLHAAVPGPAWRGDSQLESAEPLGSDNQISPGSTIGAAFSGPEPKAAATIGYPAATHSSLDLPKPEPSRETSVHAVCVSSGDENHQVQQPTLVKAGKRENIGERSDHAAKECHVPEEGSMAKRAKPDLALVEISEIIDNGSTVHAERIPIRPSIERDLKWILPVPAKPVQEADLSLFRPGSPERKKSVIRARVISPQMVADSIEQGSTNPGPRFEKPDIQVTIGRIEIRATPQPAMTQQRRPSPNLMSLNEYLRQRAGGNEK